ncbi:carboxymuconolactone decarboxylase family protein [Niabella hirudinis]|uniref:carboxymuconolactone decarboxylase family protein n=1 Tax=Niabella hirudinis TaxID=1285929 RepID=UPI003EBAFC72
MRIDYAATAPEGYKTLLAMYGYLRKTSLAPALLHLVYLRVSQINGCPYCVDLHWKDAVAAGEKPRKLNGISNWKYMPFFTGAEKAALAFAEDMTLLPGREVSDSVFEVARQYFNDKDLTDLALAIAHMNMLNRVAIAFHKLPEL